MPQALTRLSYHISFHLSRTFFVLFQTFSMWFWLFCTPDPLESFIMQNSFSLSHSILFVKNFFQVFSNFWEVIWFCSLPAFRWATRIRYHKIFSLSSFFSCFSEVFRFIITALRTACIYYHFRQNLSSFFSKKWSFMAAPHNSARGSSERFCPKIKFGKSRNTVCTRKG